MSDRLPLIAFPFNLLTMNYSFYSSAQRFYEVRIHGLPIILSNINAERRCFRFTYPYAADPFYASLHKLQI